MARSIYSEEAPLALLNSLCFLHCVLVLMQIMTTPLLEVATSPCIALVSNSIRIFKCKLFQTCSLCNCHREELGLYKQKAGIKNKFQAEIREQRTLWTGAHSLRGRGISAKQQGESSTGGSLYGQMFDSKIVCWAGWGASWGVIACCAKTLTWKLMRSKGYRDSCQKWGIVQSMILNSRENRSPQTKVRVYDKK